MSTLTSDASTDARSRPRLSQIEAAARSSDCLTRSAVVACAGKGGTGKSTILTSLAAYLAENAEVVLVDLDIDNASALRWQLLRREVGDVPVVTVVAPEVDELAADALGRSVELADAAGGPSVVLVDLPGRPRRDLSTELWQQLDLVYVPLEATLMVTGATVRLLDGYRQDGTHGPVVRPIINRWSAERRMKEAVTALGDGIVAPVSVRAYVAHGDAYAAGLGVTEYCTEHKSADDIRRLAADMRGTLRGISKVRRNGQRWTGEFAPMRGMHDA